MPRVPVVPRVVPQDGASGAFSAPGVQPVRDATGTQLAALGGATERFGIEAMDYAAQLAEDQARRVRSAYDDARTKEAVALWSEKASKLAYDPTEGYLHTIGKSALDRRKGFDKSLTDTRLEAERLLDNDVQRLAFRDWVGARELEYAKAANIHQSDQVRKYNIGQTKALGEQTAQDAVNAYGAFGGDSEEFRRLRDTARDQAMQLAVMGGLSPEEGKLLVQETNGKIAAGIVDRLVNSGRGQQAMDYLAQQPQGDIEAKALAKMRGLAQAGVKDDDALRTALAIQQETLKTLQGERGSLAQGAPLTEAQKARFLPMAVDRAQQLFTAGKIDSDSYKAIVSHIEANYARQRKADNESVVSLYNSATAQLMANPGMKWSELPLTVREELASQGKLEDLIAFNNGNNTVANDKDFMTQLWQMKATNSLASYPVDQFMRDSAGKLDNSEQKAWLLRITDAQSDNAAYRGVMSLDDKISLALLRQPRIQDQGIRMGTPEFTERRLRLSEAVGNELLKLGKKPTAKDEDEAIARALTETMLTYTSTNMAVPTAIMTAAEKAGAAVQVDGADVYPSLIKPDVADYLNGILRRAGRETSDTNRALLWNSAGQPTTLDDLIRFDNGTEEPEQQRVQPAPQDVPKTKADAGKRFGDDMRRANANPKQSLYGR